MVEKQDILNNLVPNDFIARSLEKKYDALLIGVTNNLNTKQTLRLFDVTNGFNSNQYTVLTPRIASTNYYGKALRQTSSPVIPNLVYDVDHDEAGNRTFLATNQGIYILNSTTNAIISIIKSGFIVIGDPIATNNFHRIVYRPSTDTLYCGTSDDGLYAYTISTNTNSVFNTSGGTSGGDDIPDDLVSDLTVDTINSKVYTVSTNGGGFWELNILTGAGTTRTTATVYTGNPLPSNINNCIENRSGKIFIGSNGNGFWIWTVSTNTGQTYTTSTLVTGDQLPDNIIYDITNDATVGIIWLATKSGVWNLTINTSTGKLYDSAGGGENGDQLPENQCNGIYYYSSASSKLYVSTNGGGIWVYDIVNELGYVIDKTDTFLNDSLPSAFCWRLKYNGSNNRLWTSLYSSSSGIFVLRDTVTITSTPKFTFEGNGLDDYVSLITDIATNPIKIVALKYVTTTTGQLDNIIKPYIISPFGALERKNIQPRRFISALNSQETIVDIFIENNPIYIDNKNYIEVDVNAYENINILIHYKQIYRHKLFIEQILKNEGTELHCHSCSSYTVDRFIQKVEKARRIKARRSKKLQQWSLSEIFNW
ncbi:MAG: hypothetical protein WCT85_00685 [Parachlamydiales bacterium]